MLLAIDEPIIEYEFVDTQNELPDVLDLKEDPIKLEYNPCRIKQPKVTKKKPGRRKRSVNLRQSRTASKQSKKQLKLPRVVHTCDHCGTIGSKYNIARHMSCHRRSGRRTKVVHTCDHCGLTGSKSRIIKHINIHKHNGYKIHSSKSECPDGSNRGRRIIRKFTCFTCLEDFDLQSSLLKHALIHGKF